MSIKYYAGNRLTGVSGDTKPITLPTGSTFLETNTDDLYLWDGDSWNIVAGNSIAQTFSNKTLGTQLLVTELGDSPSTPASGFGTFFAKNNKLYFKADNGTESDLTAGVGSTGSIAGASDTTFTSINDAALILYDTTTSMWRDADMSGVATINDTGVMALSSAAITGQTAEATVNNTNDFVLIYDASASALRKMSVSNLVAGGVSVDTLGALDDTTIASVASAQIIIYDGSDSWDNKTVSGDISINTSGVTAIGSGVIVDADVHASAAIAVSKLAASTITIGGTSTTLGGTITALTALTDLDLTSGDKTIFDTVGNNTLTIGASTTTVNIAGDLTVSGDATTFNVATVSVEDPLMILASNNGAADAVDIGFYGLYDTSGSQDLYSGLFRDANDSGKWKLFKDLQAAPTTTVNTSGTGYAAGTLVAALEGNATTATTLATARTIGGTSFDGSAAIVPATITVADTTDTTSFVGLWESATGDLAPKTDAGITYNAGTGMLTATGFTGPLIGNVTGNASGTAATVTGGTQASITSAANLATVGTISTGVWNGTVINDDYIDTINNADKVELTALNIDGGTAIGAAIVDADLFIVDDGGGGTNRKVAASVLKTYAAGDAADESFAIAMAVAL